MQGDPCDMGNGDADCARGWDCASGTSEHCVAICSNPGTLDPHCPEDFPCCPDGSPLYRFDGVTYHFCNADFLCS
jgi:hypothetical protein